MLKSCQHVDIGFRVQVDKLLIDQCVGRMDGDYKSTIRGDGQFDFLSFWVNWEPNRIDLIYKIKIQNDVNKVQNKEFGF